VAGLRQAKRGHGTSRAGAGDDDVKSTRHKIPGRYDGPEKRMSAQRSRQVRRSLERTDDSRLFYGR
jgi:hypothetical protein